MITAGDIEFEPAAAQDPAAHGVDIVAMTSGDSSLQAEVLANVADRIRARMATDPGALVARRRSRRAPLALLQRGQS
jgi:hypothetical protein